jgi:hypothetical protein
MCCFSQPVISVSATNIFARAGAEERQFLVYSMSLNASRDLAMILPLPVKTPTGDNDVQFIDLKGYPAFFSHLRKGFPTNLPPTAGPTPIYLNSLGDEKLTVVKVGDFEASFVPAVKDFSRLDERFRLSADTWNKLPQYETYGFAVFKLKPGAMTVHPMAFSFPRRDTSTLFFPTVHIHDGKVHPKADFDHALYCQPQGNHHLALGADWEESHSLANSFMQVNKTKGLIEADQHCYKRELHGQLPNRDTLVRMDPV